MGRLSDKLKPVNDALAALENSVERDAADVLAQIERVNIKRQGVMLGARLRLDGHMTDLVEFSNDLDGMLGNGAGDDGATSALTPPVAALDAAGTEPAKLAANAWTPAETEPSPAVK